MGLELRKEPRIVRVLTSQGKRYCIMQIYASLARNEGQNMPTIKKLSSLLASRERLHNVWRDQISALDDDRNRTAGKIYDCDNEIRQAAEAFVADEYAASWTERWPL